MVDGSFGVFTKFGKVAADKSLLVREPYLDNPLADFVGRMPAKYKVRGSIWQKLRFRAETKHLMRRVLADRMLPEVTLSKTKAGFTPPMEGWLQDFFNRHDIDAEKLLGKSLMRAGYFNIANVNRVITECREGSRMTANPLYMLLMFSLWYRLYIEDFNASGAKVALGEILGDGT
jgi:asparagine synthase (glutamine-hydrolysing)